MQQWKLSVCYTVKRNTGRLGMACALASETRKGNVQLKSKVKRLLLLSSSLLSLSLLLLLLLLI